MAKEKILLIDFNNFAHISNTGFKEGNYYIIYNFFKNLRALIESFSPNKVFFALEGRPEHRYNLYANYKQNRIKMAQKISTPKDNEDFYKQLNEIKRLLKYLPVTMVRSPKFEGDDIIATLSEDLKDEQLIIISTDTDYIQLLQKDYKDIKLYNPVKKQFIQAPDYYYICWKALSGDRSDNIPRMISQTYAAKVSIDPEKLKRILDVPEKKAKFNINRKLIEMVIIDPDDLIFEDSNINYHLLKAEFNMMEFNSITNDRSWEKFERTFKCLS